MKSVKGRKEGKDEKIKGEAIRPFEGVKSERVKSQSLLLKANRVVNCVAWLATVLWPLLGAIKKRLIHRQGVNLSREASYNCTVMLG